MGNEHRKSSENCSLPERFLASSGEFAAWSGNFAAPAAIMVISFEPSANLQKVPASVFSG
jgi:hypothetical protein